MDPTPEPNSSDAGRRPRLLIADDDAVVRSALSMQLASVFDLVTPACAAEHQPDVAIVDVEMPAGGGVEAARGIAACSPATAIVALSVDESRAVVLEMLEAGAVTYVRKGVSGSQLVSTLLHCIEAGGRA
jgi:DNA-binding NarL/FixJ family response regulator